MHHITSFVLVPAIAMTKYGLRRTHNIVLWPMSAGFALGLYIHDGPVILSKIGTYGKIEREMNVVISRVRILI